LDADLKEGRISEVQMSMT